MRALTLAGDRAAALRVADELAHALHETLSAEVSEETARLAERVRDTRVGRRVVAAPPDARARPPLVSRSVELAMLTAAWQRARSGRGQVVIVEGEPGEGKTRLIEELVAHARLDDASVATARAVPAEQKAEWSALAGLLAGGLGDAPGLAGAPPGALAGLAGLDGDLRARFRAAHPRASGWTSCAPGWAAISKARSCAWDASTRRRCGSSCAGRFRDTTPVTRS